MVFKKTYNKIRERIEKGNNYMLWLVIGEASHQIIGCNIHERDGLYQLWVERVNGKTLKINENTDQKEVALIKEAIDYAIENKESTLRLS